MFWESSLKYDIDLINKDVVLVCLLSNKSAIGDSFLDLVNNLDPSIRRRSLLIKANVYANDQFSGDIGCFNLELKKSGITFGAVLGFVKFLLFILFSKKFDRVLVYGVSPLNHLLSIFIRSKRFDYWAHDVDLHPGAYLSERLGYYLFNFCMVCRSNAHVFVSNEFLLRRLFDKGIKNSRVVSFPYISEIVNAASSPPSKLGRYFLFFGRVEPYKGLDFAISGFEKEFSEGDDVFFVVAGKGNCLPDLGGAVNVLHYNRYISNENLKELIENAIACVFTYSSATGTQAVQTALSLGCPCVLSKIPTFEYISNQISGFGTMFADDEVAYRELLRGFFEKKLDFDRSLLKAKATAAFSPGCFGDGVSKILNS